MMSTDDRRQQLQSLLERLRRNRESLAVERDGIDIDTDAELTLPEAAAPLGLTEPTPLELPVTGAELADESALEPARDQGPDLELDGADLAEENANRSIELDTAELIELVSDEIRTPEPKPEPLAPPAFAPAAPPEAQAEAEEEEEEDLIELTMDEEVAAEEEPVVEPAVAPAAVERAGAPLPPTADAEATIEELGPPEHIVAAGAPATEPEPEPAPQPTPSSTPPPAARPTPPPEAEAAPEEDFDDDEPEIEVTYDSDEALALSEELGLDAEELEGGRSDTQEDLQVLLADRPVPTAQIPGMSEAEREEAQRAARLSPPVAEDLPRPVLPDLPAPPLALDDLPARQVAPAPSTTSPERYEGAPPPVAAEVAEVVSSPAPRRAGTLGELLRAALAVGRRRPG